MAKSERLFEMLQYIREYPHLTAQDLARLCDVSVRGVYRYLNTLSRSGIPVHFQGDGYVLPEDSSNLLKRFDIEDLQAIRKLLSIGMSSSDNDELRKYGMSFLELIDENLPESQREASDEIEIMSEWSKPSSYGGTVTIGHSSKPDIINPILTCETISTPLLGLIFSSPVKFDSAQRPVPDLAKDWAVSKDGLVWTFHLRDDVVFHDGYPLTAHDVEFTYRSIMDPKHKSPMAERYNLVDKIETKGDYVFRITLKYPCSPFIHRMSREIAPRHILEKENLLNTSFNRRPIGSGPFRLTEWTKDNTIILDANREYFCRERPGLDRLVFKAYPDREAALQAITRGEMDIALNLAASDLLFVSRHGGYRIYPAQGASYYALIFNLKDPVFSDIRVRKALDYAIDKELVIKNQLKGYSRICTGPFSVNSWAYNHDVPQRPYEAGTARELLRRAGWRDINGVLYRDDKPFELQLTIPDISDSLERVALAVKAQLTKIGIKVKLIYIGESGLYRIPFQVMLSRISAGADPDYIYGLWHSQSGDTNLAAYENKYVDVLLEQGRNVTDPEKRRAIYHRIHEIIHDDCPAVFLASGCEFIGSNYRFRDARFSSTLHFFTTVKDWRIISTEGEKAVVKQQKKVGVIS